MSSIKRDVKKKVLPRPEARCFLEIQPTATLGLPSFGPLFHRVFNTYLQVASEV
jgi:hypothetical protein